MTKLLGMTEVLKEKGGSVHMIPLEAFEGGRCWAFISRDVLKLTGIHLWPALVSRTHLRTFPLKRQNTKLLIYLYLLLSLLRVRNDQKTPQGKSWEVQLGVLFSKSNDIQVSQDRTPSGDQEGSSQLWLVSLDVLVLSAKLPWDLEVM